VASRKITNNFDGQTISTKCILYNNNNYGSNIILYAVENDQERRTRE